MSSSTGFVREDDLQCALPPRVFERVVRPHDVAQAEAMCNQSPRLEPSRRKGLVWLTRFGNGAVVGESYGLHTQSYALRRAEPVPFAQTPSSIWVRRLGCQLLVPLGLFAQRA